MTDLEHAQLLQRIKTMESIHNACHQAVENLIEALEAYRSLEPSLRTLERYYTSPQWLADREAEDAGEIPQNLSRGILSEDAIWNLLCHEHQALKQMRNLASRSDL